MEFVYELPGSKNRDEGFGLYQPETLEHVRMCEYADVRIFNAGFAKLLKRIRFVNFLKVDKSNFLNQFKNW